MPSVHAAEDNTIRLALIGCGGRGSGAVGDAFWAADGPVKGPVKLHVMADVIDKRLEASHKTLSKEFGDRVDVPKDRQFVGFDAYRKAIDCLKPGDVAMLTGYAGFRPVQLEYAVDKGVNVFMEKSFAADPPGVRRVIKAGEAAEKKNLKIAAGLMCRHSVNRQELIKRIRDGELGEIQLIRAYRMEPVGPLGPKPAGESELLWQFRNFIRFLWVAGGLYAEMDIHQIDEICWIKGENPVSAHGVGGRAANSTDCGQNLDSFAAEWTFADGTKATDVVRYIPGCFNEFATFIHGTKCAAQFSGTIHAADGADLQGPADRQGQHRLEGPRGNLHFLAGRMEGALGQHPQRQAAQRGQTGGRVEPGRHHGPGGDSLGQGDHVGRGDGLELPVLPGHRHDELRHARRRSSPTPTAATPCPCPDSGRRFRAGYAVATRIGEEISAAFCSAEAALRSRSRDHRPRPDMIHLLGRELPEASRR